jgi:biopolymer transport protein ExbD
VDELKQLVMERVHADPELKVYLRADKATPHKNVKAVMQAMAAAGVGDFIFGVYTGGKDGGEE